MSATIALDAMGGDFGPSVVVPAALRVLEQHSDVTIILVGQEEVLAKQLVEQGASQHQRLVIHHAPEVVAMDESPALALRNKKNSSMRIAINLVKEGVAGAAVSAGNTGALMATARFVLKTLPGIDRPAIITSLPTTQPDKHFRMLDLGANVDSTPEHLFQFAVMASVLCKAVDNNPQPKIGLLNNGQEEIKGNELVKQTAALLGASSAIHYVGYVEGDAIYKGVVDIVVCDGFVGNLVLKSMEGTAKLVGTYLKREFKRNLWTLFQALIAKPVLKSVYKQIDPGRYNGATLLGLRGTVIKSHGSADIASFAHAIEEAIVEVAQNVPQLINEQVKHVLQVKPSELPPTPAIP